MPLTFWSSLNIRGSGRGNQAANDLGESDDFDNPRAS
jgi:hypothetical protein